jgi:hypothetical protein
LHAANRGERREPIRAKRRLADEARRPRVLLGEGALEDAVVRVVLEDSLDIPAIPSLGPSSPKGERRFVIERCVAIFDHALSITRAR